MSTTANILDPAALIASLPSLLPESSKVLQNPQDALAALIHTAFITLGFRLVSIDEAPPSSTPTAPAVLPIGWSKDGPGHYTLKYKHDQSSLEFLVKLSKLGPRTVINAIALESDKVATLDIPTDGFSSPSFFPHTVGAPDGQPLINGFISSSRISDLMFELKFKIFQKLLPGLRKEGYTEEPESTALPIDSSSRPNPRQPPPRTPPENPNRSYIPPLGSMPRNPLEIGRRDLDPFPNNPFSPPSLFPSGSGDGMFVGPDHPIFSGRGGRGGFNAQGPWGGDGFLPPLGAPPGARFDPVGPAFPNRPPGRFGQGNTPRGSGQDPDNDEFMPPGMGDMFM